jgi:hypothetical protein
MKFLKNDLQNVTRDLCLVFFFIYGFSTFSQDTLMLKINVKKIVKTIDFNDDFLACVDFPSGDKVHKFAIYEISEIRFANGDVYKNESPLIVKNPNKESNTNAVANECDIIIFKNGNEVKSHIIEVSNNELKYKKHDFLDGPTFVVMKSDIFMIKYKNGTKDIINIEGQKDIFSKDVNTQKTYSNSNFAESSKQGENDAITNYRTGGAFAAGFSSFILTPLFALIPTAIITSIEPNDSNLKYPNIELYNTDPNYKAAYKKQAFKMKKRATWTGYGLGAFINIFAGLVIFFNN